MFDPRRLQFLQAVDVHGTVLDAAIELGVTASAVSQQIGKLEREIGAPLLERVGRGVVLTDAARVLVEAAEEYAVVTERATARLEDLRGEDSGTLRVACFPSVIGPVVAPMLARLRIAAPGLQVRVQEMFPDRAEDAVIAGHVDVAIIHLWGEALPPTAHGLASVPIADDIVDVILHPDHPHAGDASVSLEVLADDPWVMDDLEGFMRTWLTRQLTAAGRRPRVEYRVDEISAQLALVRHGLCDALLPRLAVPDREAGIVRVPLDITPFRRIHALYRQAAAERPVVRRFLQEVRAVSI